MGKMKAMESYGKVAENLNKVKFRLETTLTLCDTMESHDLIPGLLKNKWIQGRKVKAFPLPGSSLFTSVFPILLQG